MHQGAKSTHDRGTMMKSRRLLLFAVNRATPFTTKTSPYTTSLRLLSSSNSNNSNSSSKDAHADYLQQVQELNDERQALFGFTREEEAAWQNPQVHSSVLMDAVEQVRKTAAPLSQGDCAPHHDVDFRQEEAVECTTPTTSSSPFPSSLFDDKHDNPNIPFTHLDTAQTGVNMVNVGDKQVTKRTAKARSSVHFTPEVMAAFSATKDELVGPKGPIFATAKIAGIMAAKRTSDLIPLCHPLPLDNVQIDVQLHGSTAIIECECQVTSKTGVEMEALTGASIAALTIYDMCKAISHRITIQETILISKSGGKRTIDVENEGAKEA